MRQWTVDAFAAQPFRGNPACVVEPLDAWRDDAWMQALARENNQAETAFLLKTSRPDRFGLRWFTPGMEVPLCGHATLASGHVLLHELGVGAEAITFETRFSGELIVGRKAGAYEMDFPADPPRQVEIPAGLAEALGAQPVEAWSAAYFVALFEDAETIRRMKPDLALVATQGGEATGGPGQICVAALSGEGGVDVVDRFFAPGCGVPEDPTTGSMHCILGPLYAEKLGRPTVRFHQAFPGRGGNVETELHGERILIRGQAFTTVESVLRV
ncbi:MAG: PhzF family phenazine biosynthesis protein [Proteobacteria bacterium]|nr:PhzF family phenazine biosynthesis protein [Pseudomonadota bacterium]